jgi:hypothetical protein
MIKTQALKDRHYPSDIMTTNPPPQQVCAHHAFVGGRIELLRQGYLQSGALWLYDIASAYPSAMMALPSMRGGKWVHHKKRAEDNADICRTAGRANMLSMFRVRWNYPSEATDGWPIPFYPFPYRVRSRGQILFPSAGRAWIMRDEVLAACAW